jgi:hypothetical protein
MSDGNTAAGTLITRALLPSVLLLICTTTNRTAAVAVRTRRQSPHATSLCAAVRSESGIASILPASL